MSAIDPSVHHSAHPEMLDRPITLVPLHLRVWLVLVAIVLVALVLWGFVGRLPLAVEAAGILTYRVQLPEALTYVSATQAQELRPGMSARVLPRSGGVIAGQVVSVAPSPVSPEQAAALIGAKGLTTSSLFEVHIALDSAQFAEGAPCTISIPTRDERPVSRVLPIFS